MATTAAVLNESAPAPEYARLEERILARDQKGASDVLYRLMKQGRPLTEITRETVRIHAYTSCRTILPSKRDWMRSAMHARKAVRDCSWRPRMLEKAH